MSEDLIIKKRMKLIQKAFPSYSIDRDGVNIAVNCVNKKCSTHSRKEKKKLCLRVDNEYYHCWVCGFKGKGLARFFQIICKSILRRSFRDFSKAIKRKRRDPGES